MKHQNINVIENGIKITLNLGRQGEYNVRDIKFDMSDFQQKYGDGTATIVHFPANGSAYTVPSLSGESKDSAILDGESLIWTIGKLATRYDGNGIAIITWVTLDGLKKSIKYNTYCKESVGDYGAEKSAQQSYIDQMIELASTITDLSSEFSDAERIAVEIVDARENAVSDIETLKNDAVSAVNTAKSESIEDIGDSKESALDALNTAKQTALADIESAKQDAETDINAEILIAETHANNASQSATNASNSATNASNSADSADQSAASAQTSATNASNSAASASQSASNASLSANSASQSATSAQTSANNASTSEQNARQSAETAQDVLESVQAEGNTQISRVQAEGNTQIGRVQAKGKEIIDSLPDDFTQVQKDIASLNGSLEDIRLDSDNLLSDIFAVANLSDITDFSNSYILGGYTLTNGNFYKGDSTVIDANQKAFELFSDEITICVADGMRARGIILGPDKSYSAYFNWVTGGNSKPDALQNKKGYYIKPIIGKINGSKITQEEVSAYGADLFKILHPVETPIADKYDPADSYSNGDMRIHGGKLYKCADDYVSGQWDSGKWRKTTVVEELKNNSRAKAISDTMTEYSVNVLDPNTLIDNGYYYDFTDGITQISNDTAGTKITASIIRTGLIPSLHIRQTFNNSSTARITVYFYADDAYLGYRQVQFAQIGSDDYEMATYPGANGIRVYVNNKNPLGNQICIATSPLSSFVPYGFTYKIKQNQLNDKLKGKKIVNFGDSIFGNKRPPNDISTEIARLTGATVYNCGFGGCRMSQASANWNPFSMYSLAYAIANNDFTEQDAVDIDTAGLPSYFKETRALLKNIDFSDVDIVTIAYGTNDFTSGVTLDNNENPKDTTTFAGALRYSLETLWSAFPHLEIFICTPTYRFWMDSSNVFQYDSDTHEVGGQLLTQFVSKVIDVAKSYHVPYIDNYNVGINQFTRTAWFPSNDGTHHNYEGAKLIAKHMANKLY